MSSLLYLLLHHSIHMYVLLRLFFQEIERLVALEEIQYYGFQEDVKSYIKKCHCVVLPSYHEGMANVLLEAGSMKKNPCFLTCNLIKTNYCLFYQIFLLKSSSIEDIKYRKEIERLVALEEIQYYGFQEDVKSYKSFIFTPAPFNTYVCSFETIFSERNP